MGGARQSFYIPAGAALTAVLLGAGCATSPEPAVPKTPMTAEQTAKELDFPAQLVLLAQTAELLRNHYPESAKVTDEELLNGAFKGMLQSLDPYSTYEPPAEVRSSASPVTGEVVGIGINLVKRDHEPLQIVSVIPGSPAADAGLRAGDRVLEIDRRSTAPMSFERCREAVTGAPGTKVELRWLRENEPNARVTAVARRKMTIPTIQPESIRLLAGGIGYVRLDNFNKATVADFDRALEVLRKKGELKALLIDLRNNPGGMVSSAVALASRFLPDKAEIFHAKGRRGQQTEHPVVRTLPVPWRDEKLPVYLLVNGYSASAAEIFAGALQAHKRATLVGGRTFGKGSIQRRQMLPNGGAIRYTIAHYRTPSDLPIDRVGIAPNEEIPTSERDSFRLSRQMVRYPGEVAPQAPQAMRDTALEKALAMARAATQPEQPQEKP